MTSRSSSVACGMSRKRAGTLTRALSSIVCSKVPRNIPHHMAYNTIPPHVPPPRVGTISRCNSSVNKKIAAGREKMGVGLKGVCKPGFVASPTKRGRRSFLWVGRCLPTLATHPRERGPRTPHFGLAPGGVCRANPSPDLLVRSAHLFTDSRSAVPTGRLFSVALSPDCSGPPLTATFALWSPDFPPAPSPRWRPRATARPPSAQGTL
jgi:hypothetical protein